jgi:hypothetical protein
MKTAKEWTTMSWEDMSKNLAGRSAGTLKQRLPVKNLARALLDAGESWINVFRSSEVEVYTVQTGIPVFRFSTSDEPQRQLSRYPLVHTSRHPWP